MVASFSPVTDAAGQVGRHDECVYCNCGHRGGRAVIAICDGDGISAIGYAIEDVAVLRSTADAVLPTARAATGHHGSSNT